jgi:tetratricopeptide (TPR) repeat protein
VSQVLAHSESSTTIPNQIAGLRRDLDLPEAHDLETRLRILTILGMLETNYDASMARQTWSEVESLANKQHHYLLASRAVGEQGIAAFLLGDMATAKKDVEHAWLVAKVADPAAHIRYASMYGTGLVELHKYKEALGPLDEAIKVAAKTRDAAYPSIAATAKIEAPSGIGQNDQALALAAEVMQEVEAHHLTAHLYELHQASASVYEHMGNWQQAVSDLSEAVGYAKQLSYWRGMTQADGLLAAAYLHQGALQPALAAINEAIESNKQIPDELYFVPKDLAIKAAILTRLGKLKASDDLYEKSTDMLDALLSKVPTPMVERLLLSDLGTVYAGYFESLSDQGRIADAFREIERARGRVEAQGLSRHDLVIPHEPTSAELRLTKLNLQLLDADDPAKRTGILEDIYTAEQQVNGYAPESVPTPVALKTLQRNLPPSELFIEYVLDDPQSYQLAVTRTTVHRYVLAPKAEIEQDAAQYRSEIAQKKSDLALAERLFQELLGRIPEFIEKPDVVVVPDGKLHLLPFSALADGGKYVLTSHVVSVIPSGTVSDMLMHRANRVSRDNLPYVGVAAWISKAPASNLLATITRAVSGPERAELVALPESRNEVETIAGDLPKPGSNPLSTPIIAFQRNHFAEGYFKGTISVHHGRQEWKTGVESDNVFLHERFADVITDPSQFDPGTPTTFSFAGSRPDLEQSAFVQDVVRLGNWTISAGLRWDHYQLIVNQTAFSPRLGVSRYSAKTELLVHAAYDRVFQTPAFENILLSSSPDVVVLNPSVLRVPVEPSRGNYYEIGIMKGFSGKLSLDVNSYFRSMNNFADDNLLLNTPVSFPIAFRTAQIYGSEGKVSIPGWGRLSGFVSYSYMVGSAYFPVTGGFFLGQSATNALTQLSGRFWVSQDQRNTVRTRFRYQFVPRLWGAVGAEYGSGLPIDFDGTYEEALAQYGRAVVDRVNFDRDRVKPSLSVEASVGADLWRRDNVAVRMQFDAQNLNNRLNLINFAGLFSGNAIAPPRSYAIRLKADF